jgi:hypothetical protein
MPATLRLTHEAIGVEVRRGTYDIVVDGQRAGSVEMNDTIEIPIEPGRHTLQFASRLGEKLGSSCRLQLQDEPLSSAITVLAGAGSARFEASPGISPP